MNDILEKLMAALPKVEAGATHIIELAAAIKTAAQEAGTWTQEHESSLQVAIATATGTSPKTQ